MKKFGMVREMKRVGNGSSSEVVGVRRSGRRVAEERTGQDWV